MKYNWTSLYSKKATADYKPKELLKILSKNREIDPENFQSFIVPKKPKQLTVEDVGIDPKELEKAVQLIKKKGKKNKIIIYGDFDVDGLCATALLWEALWQKDYDVLPFIPNRETGYGLKKEVISRLIERYPDLGLLITVDNGIVAHQAVEYAKKQGLDVIVTDHHLKQSGQLLADAVVHTIEIAGCGVAWFLANQFGYQKVDLTSLGTITDMMPLVGANRSFVKYGLKELSKSDRVGIRALKRISGLELGQELAPWEISFILGPRLNAAGRISDPMDGLRLLCSRRQSNALKLAQELDGLNRQRQEMTEFGVELAKELAKKEKGLIFVSSPDFHPGIIGLIAGKLTEEFNRPVIAVSEGKEVSKGSARSIPGVNIVELIRHAEDILIDVGGHSMAAGFTVETDKIGQLFNQLCQVSKDKIKDSDLIIKKNLDFEIDFSLIRLPFYRLVQKLSPFGIGNPQPTFILKNARVMNIKTVGSDGSHLKLWLDDPKTPKIERISAEAIGFGWGYWQNKVLPGDLVNVVFNFNLNRWNGKQTLQLKIKDIELC